jgi:membrane protein required for colicin V production
MTGFTHTDWVIVGILGLSVLVSVFRGFVREAFSLATWVIAGVVAFRFSELGAERLAVWIETPSIQLIVSFLVIFVLILVVGGLIGVLVGQMVKHTGLSGTDRALGALFGLTRGVVLITIGVILAGLTPFMEDPWWQDSVLLPHFETMAEQVVGQLPPALQDQLLRSQGLEI